MTGIVNFITARINRVDLTNPLSLFDLLVALSLIVFFLIYIRRFPVFRVFLGILVLIFSSIVFLAAGLTLTALIFGVASNLILISLPLIFAPEIRHYLEKIGRFSYLKIPFSKNSLKTEFLRNLVDAAYELAERKIGAILVLQRRTGLGETIDSGVIIDAKFGNKLLHNLFFPKSPMHDGAVVIKGNRIIAAGCLLPIHSEIKLDHPFGTRHKAAVAITQDTDAVVVVISEQRGEVSLAENGKLHINLDKAGLTDRLNKLISD